jgi:2-polyprenyl-6-methoxyphenol hydroxylase-like FAD-dependent oxidoreductase
MNTQIKTRCCVAGGGPAGMVLGFLLARAGVDVWVLEKHADFLRDFRGDTIHPSTMQVMHELGLLDEFLKRPHQEVHKMVAHIGNDHATVGDMTHLPTRCKFIAFMPQWDFLNFMEEHARRYPTFHLKMQAEVTDLIEDNGRVCGVRAKIPEGELEIRAALTVGADGRQSTVRERAGFVPEVLGAPMDVLWMRISRLASDPSQTLGRFDSGKLLVMLNRQDYWQLAYVIPKGSADELRKKDISVLRERIVQAAPYLQDRVGELRSWDEVKLLTVAVDRLRQWAKPGVLCIGDAAHAMSPIGGVGINLAIQDAVATANILAERLRQGTPSQSELDEVQKRRMFPTRATQKMQIAAQNGIVKRVLETTGPLAVPWQIKLMQHFPVLQRIPARLIGLGFRPEHVQCREYVGAVDTAAAAD